MANRFWVGGTGTWNTTSTTNWSASSGGASGASVPTAADSVFFDQATTYTVTMTGALLCLDITVSAGTVTFATGTTPTLAVTGSMSLVAGTVWNSTGTITFNATTTGKTITTNGTTINGAVTFAGVGGGWSLGSALTTGATLTTTLTNGALTLNGFDLTTGIFSSSNANTRSIIFGNNNIILAHTTAAQTVLNMATSTGCTVTTGTGGFVTDASVTRTLTTGTVTSAAANLTFTGSGSSAITITSNTFYKNIDFGTIASTIGTALLTLSGNVTLSTGGTFTGLSFNMGGNGTTITSKGRTIGSLNILVSPGFTVTLADALTTSSTASVTLTSGTLVLNGFNLTTGQFISSGTTTRAISFGSNNIVLTHTTAATTVLSFATATGFTWTGTGGFTTDASITRTVVFGTTGGTAANAPNLTLTGSGTAIITFTTGSYFKTLDFGTTAFTIAATSLNLNGLTLSSGGTFTNLTPTMVGTGNITSNSNTTLAAMTINSTTGTTTLASAFTLTATSTFTLTSGTLALANFTLTCGIFSSSVTTTRSISFGSGTIVLAHTTAAQLVLSIGDATNFTFTGTGGFASAMSVTRSFACGTVGGSTTCAVNLSITSGASVPTFYVGSWFTVLDFTGSTCTPALTATTNGIYVDTLTLATGGTYTSLIPIFTRTQTWTAQFGKQLGGNGFNVAAGTLTLDNTQTYTITSTFFLVAGTLDLGGFDLTIGIFSSTTTVVRSIAFGTNNIILTNTTGTAVLNMAVANGFTYTGTGGWITDASVARTLTFGTTGGTATNCLPLTITGSGTAIITLLSNSFWKTLDFGTTAFTLNTSTQNVGSLKLSTGGTFTGLTVVTIGTGSITSNGKTIAALTINGTGITTTLNDALSFALATATTTLTSGTLNLNGFDLTTGIFSSNNANARSISFGSNNIILATTTAAQTVLNIATATGFSYTGTGGFVSDASVTRTFNWGATTGGTTATAPNLSFTGSGTAVQTFQSGGKFGSLNFGTTAFSINAGVAVALSLNSLTLSSGGTFSSLTATMWGTGTVTGNGNATLLALNVNAVGGITTSLGDALTMLATGTVTITNGTLALNGFNLTTGIFASSGTGTRAISFGSNNIVLAHTTAGTTVLSFATATGFTWTGTGGFTTDASITRTLTFGTTGGSATISPNMTLTGSGTAVITFTTGSYFNTLNFGTTAFNPGTTTLNLNSLTLSTGGTFTTLTATMVGTGTITPNGQSIAALTINSTTGTTTLAAALTLVATGTTTITSGTLALNGFDLTTGIFASSGTATRAISFGSNNIVLAHTTAATTVLSFATATGFTWTGTGGFTTDASITRTVVFGTTGGTAANAPNMTLTGSGTAVITFTTASWYNNLNFGTTAFNPGTTALSIDGDLTLSSGGTFTGLTATMVGTGTITPNGQSIAALTINSTTGTTTLAGALSLVATGTTTLTSGTLALANFTLTTGIFSSTGAVTRSISFGSGNIVLSHTTALTTVLSMATATGFTYTGTGGFTTDASITRTVVFGTTGGSSTNAPNLTLTGSGTAVITFTTGSYFNTLSFGTTVFNPGTTALNLNSLTLSTGGTFTGLTATMVGTGTITSNGQSIAALTINSTTGTTTLAAALNLVATGTTTLTSGTLALNGFDLTTGIFASSGTATRAISFGSNNIVLAHTTAATTVLSFATATGFTYTGTGGFTTDASITRTVTFGTTGGATTNAPNLSLTGSGTAIITFTTASWFNNLTFGTTAFTIAATSLSINGNLTLSSGGTFTNLTVTTVGTGTITSNTKTIAALTINSTSGTTTLGDALSLVATGTTTLTSGTLALGGYDLTTGIFSSSNSTTRSISFGANYIVLSHTTATTTVLSMATATNFTNTGAGGFTTNMTVARTFTFGTTGGSSTNSPNLFITAGASNATLTTGSYFNKLDCTGTYSGTIIPNTPSINLNSLTLNSTGVYSSLNVVIVGTGTLTSNGSTTGIRLLTINAPGGTVTLGDDFITGNGTGPTGVATTLTAGTLNLNNFNLTTYFFSSNNTNTRSINFGSGNIILIYSSAGSITILDMADATNLTVTGSGGFYKATLDFSAVYTFGTTGGSYSNSPNLTFGSGTAGSVTLTTGSYFNKIDFGTTTSTPTTATLNISALTLSSGGTYTNLSFNVGGTGTITPNGKSIVAMTINHSGTTTLAGALTTTTSTTLSSGTLALAGFTLTPTQFISGAAATRAISGSGTGIISLSNNWTVSDGTGFTGSDYTIRMTKATSKTFAGAGGSYGTLVQAGAGALTISGSNTLVDIQATTRPSTISFTAGTTQTVTDFTLVGTAGNLVTINSTTPGTQFTLSKSSGTVDANYLSIADSNATGGATWNAGANSIDLGNNTGWIFTPPPVSGAGGQFFAFF